MKALVYEGPKAVSYREVPAPILSQGHVLIKIKAVGICGSDMHSYLGHDERRPAPLILVSSDYPSKKKVNTTTDFVDVEFANNL